MIICPSCSNEVEGEPKFCPSCGANLAVIAKAGGDPYIGKLVAGKYLVEKLLGEGGMGKVYLAIQQPLDKQVVLKVLRQQLHGDPSLVARFQREARASSRLSHPNSIQVTDFGQMEDGALYIAMEYLEGRDLGQLLQEEGPLPQARLVHIMDQVLSALADAHAAKIIHRDLKPENIMIVSRRDDKDYVKVLDFGIAKLQDTGDSPDAVNLTQQGLVCGTPEYMSPEQARGEALAASSDLYAIGVILFQLSTGKLPFNADTSVGMVTKHLIEEPPPARTINPQVGSALEQLILKCMAKDAALRPESAESLREMLHALGTDPVHSASTAVGAPAPSTAAGGTDPAPMMQGGAPSPSPAPVPASGGSGSLTGLPPLDGQVPSLEAELEAPMPGSGSGKLFIAIGVVAILGAASGGYWIVSHRNGGAVTVAGGGAPIKGTKTEPNAGGSADPTGAGAVNPNPGANPGATPPVAEKPGPPARPHGGTRPPRVTQAKDGGRRRPPGPTRNAKLAKKYSMQAQRAWAHGQFQQAIELYSRAAKANPSDPVIQRRLGTAYLTQGDQRRATLHLRRYLALSPRARDRRQVEVLIGGG